MTINSILKNHKSIRTWFIVTIVLGSVSLLGLLFVGVWGIFNGMADLCWLFFIVGFFIAINAVGVCIALLGFAVTIDKAKLAEVGADRNRPVFLHRLSANLRTDIPLPE